MPEAKIKENKSEYLKQKINFFLVNYFHWLKIGLFLVILLMGLFLIIKPKYTKAIKSIEQSREQNQTKYDILQEHLSRLNKLNSAYKKIGADNIEKINAMLPGGGHYEDLFPQMESIIRKRGLFLQSMEINSGEKNEEQKTAAAKAKEAAAGAQAKLPAEIIKVSLSIKIVGADYANLKALLNDFENNIQLLDIVNLNFSPAEQSASFIVDTYYIEDDNQ
ncbi:hypothetical protein KKC83_06370 [Patescibacteria group bacterium]|nr:hypothetical protein [Candidatus Falkowbacteria bacterium]MBU3906319.1 hypothetical protein [Patescibacteria group bacterium]MBU4015602.1 hypothetical protein [Patescibacteria group bacterium]MBU4027138.1 hypothetical protein [Patescibacteria group bacterium]MBU4072727.1 hypothetical protein [Patescibacteria group bacterium]